MNAHFAPDAGTERWVRSAYEPSGRGRLIAMLISLGVTGGLVSSLLLLNVVGVEKARPAPLVVEMQMLPDEPPAPPKQPPKPEKAVLVPSQVVAPQPAVVVPMPALAIPVSSVSAPVSEPAPVQAPPAPAPAPAPKEPADGGDLTGNLISSKPPSYPIESRRSHEQGTVVLAVLLSPTGSVAEISVAKSSGFARLDKAALAAVRKWRWAPFKRDGVPVMVRGQVTIPFVLQG